jgi:hypothetical protein
MLLTINKQKNYDPKIKLGAVTGPLTETRLKLLVSYHRNWESWKKKYPHTKALSGQNGFQRSYNGDPCQGYESSSRLMFGVTLKNLKYHHKEKVIGIGLCGKAKIYAFLELSKIQSPVKDVFDKILIQV